MEFIWMTSALFYNALSIDRLHLRERLTPAKKSRRETASFGSTETRIKFCDYHMYNWSSYRAVSICPTLQYEVTAVDPLSYFFIYTLVRGKRCRKVICNAIEYCVLSTSSLGRSAQIVERSTALES